MEVRLGQKEEMVPSILQEARGKILIVDDSPVNLKVMTHYLKQLGCSTETAINGEEAVMLVEKNRYDLVFMDAQMPVKDGISATREIRSLGKNVPIIGVSASMESEKSACLEAGMNAYITKPVDRRELAEILQQFCKKRPLPQQV